MKEEIFNKTTLSQHKGVFVFITENSNPEINKQNYIGFAVFLEESLDFISFFIGPDS